MRIEPLTFTEDELRCALREEYEHLDTLEGLTAADLLKMAYDNLARKVTFNEKKKEIIRL